MAACVLTGLDRHTAKAGAGLRPACLGATSGVAPTRVAESVGYSVEIPSASTPSASKVKARSPSAGSWLLWVRQTDALPPTPAHAE
jgi:hypothetical protein